MTKEEWANTISIDKLNEYFKTEFNIDIIFKLDEIYIDDDGEVSVWITSNDLQEEHPILSIMFCVLNFDIQEAYVQWDEKRNEYFIEGTMGIYWNSWFDMAGQEDDWSDFATFKYTTSLGWELNGEF